LREVEVWPAVHNTLWQHLSKQNYDRLCDWLFDKLENQYEDCRRNRHPEDETLFVCAVRILQGDTWHTFEFLVDDVMADTHLFVVGVNHRTARLWTF
jgi:hypothetical protein